MACSLQDRKAEIALPPTTRVSFWAIVPSGIPDQPQGGQLDKTGDDGRAISGDDEKSKDWTETVETVAWRSRAGEEEEEEEKR